MTRNNKPTLIVSTILLLAGACDRSSDGKSPPSESDADGQTPADTRSTLAPTLKHYETIREKLAADDMSGAVEAAKALHKAADKAEPESPQNLRKHISGSADAAEALSRAPVDDPDAVRKAFGEVSRSVVALLAAEPSLREGLNIFECSMAQGYQKWVQKTETIENPYMGSQMLACGTKATWDG